MKVPLVETQPPPEFGAIHTDPSFGDPTGASFDHTYVPGFSDLRRQRDLEILEVRQGTRKAKDVSTLPVNLRWVRAQKSNGDPDNTKLWTSQQRGYVPVKPEDIGQHPWLKELPLGAVKDANGMIRNGDTVLCVASAANAGRNEARKAAQTRARNAAATEAFAAELSKQHVTAKGADPTVEVTVGKRKEK